MIRYTCLILALLTPLTLQAEPIDAQARAEALIAAFKAVKAPHEGQALSAADLKANEAAFLALDGFLDREALTHAPITPHAAHFKPEQLSAFKALFWQTLRLVAYPNSGAFFAAARYTLTPAKPSKEGFDVALHAVLEAEDLETDITLHWSRDGRLVDVSFDGASLVLDYRNQFGRVIKDKGVEGLIRALEAKHAQVTGAK
ncbi:ABC transporter substrate-binding protein [Myxococcota bacterium]|nr:ABC transporter substrate-binding protein [Myxococcota bacterium]MBU1900295.1 ABC transporter substrate-binding protein [Myxococcota bacterium]